MHLVDVMNICFPLPEADNDTELHQSAVSTLSRTARAAKWKELVNELRIWHTNRPLGLQALLEVDDPESTFPTVVFTSGAGISSNALYHTAMLLLLSDEQVDAQYSSAETNTPEMSPLWHARRVCGIGINSEPGHMHCWDPVFIAAFSLAARRITHPSQRDTIITCLYHVKATGWHIDSLVDKLHSDWDSGLDR
jgi:hypothetical protein